MRSWLADFRYSFRTLRKMPLFTAVAVVSLALGIGANTAIFTLLDQLMLRLLPVKAPEQLVMIFSTGPHMGNNRGSRAASYPMYQDFQRRAEAFSYVFCRFETPASISIDGRTERVDAELVSGNFFQALGVGAAAGRVFTPEDDRQYKGHPVVVLSYQYWASRFAGDPHVIGKKMLVNNYPMTIVGVSAAGFAGLDPSQSPQIRVPIQMKPIMTPGWDELGNRRSQWIHLFARMKPGYTLERARASLQPLFHNILDYELTLPEAKDFTPYNRNRFLKRVAKVEPAATGYSQMRESFSTALIVLMSMVALVLLIACCNVANLLIARAAARQKEIAVRLAIGASRARLVRQLLVESVLLAGMGGVLGIGLSVWVIRVLLGFLPSDGTVLLLSAEPDWRILGFNFAVAAVTGVLFGLAPALQSMRLDLWNVLKDIIGVVAGPAASVRLRKGLVVAQVALSFLLLAGATLFARSLANLQATNPGFRDLNRLVSFQLDPALNGYSVARIHAFYTELLANIRALPGVKTAGYAAVPLLRGWEWDSTMGVEGHQAKDGEDMQAFMNEISPGYFQTMGVPLLAGRDFDDRDRGEPRTVAIVNRKFAEHFFGNRPALGRHIGFGIGPKSKLDMEIIGVVENSLYEGPREGVHRQAFVANLQSEFPASVAFYVRTSADPGALYAALRREVRKLDPAMPVFSMKTLRAQLDETLTTERLIAALSAAFGVLATVLAAVGLYGIMAFVVTRRTRELGLRVALGAQRRAVVWLVLREILVLLAGGIAIGLPCAYALTRYMSSQLFGVPPADPAAGIAAVLVLMAAAVAAGVIPARRAGSIDPMRALRYE